MAVDFTVLLATLMCLFVGRKVVDSIIFLHVVPVCCFIVM
jgi:hypothetical protein